MGVSRFLVFALVLTACGDRHSEPEHRAVDAAVDASIDATQYECDSETDCEPGELCCLIISPAGVVSNPYCGTPGAYCAASICDPLASSCGKVEFSTSPPTVVPGTCTENVKLSYYDNRLWNVCQ